MEPNTASHSISSARSRTFAMPELLEQILLSLLDTILTVSYQEDPRSVRTHSNARVLTHLLRCSQVCRQWRDCVIASKPVQRGLYLLPDPKSPRSWNQKFRISRAPLLNPVIQTAFPSYHFRFWHLSLEASGSKHVAYMIIARRELPPRAAVENHSVSKMLLAQPPCTELCATVWEERDETKDYIGGTSKLRDSIIRCDEGLTVGMVHRKVSKMFEEHPDVAIIKLTTT